MSDVLQSVSQFNYLVLTEAQLNLNFLRAYWQTVRKLVYQQKLKS